jgi:predicted  nucleic acid-binding Zn-ribbon protein
LDELVELAEKSEEDQLKSMDEVDKQIEKMHRKAKAQQESDYKFADNLVKKAKSKQSYEDAKSIFEFLGNYKDAPERVIQCQNKIESIEEKQRKAEERAAAERKAAEERAEAERKAAAEKAERERQEKIAKLNAEKTSLQDELANLKGLFSGKRRKEIEVQIAKIDRQLAAVDAELGRTQN